jgi:hypothetical protein
MDSPMGWARPHHRMFSSAVSSSSLHLHPPCLPLTCSLFWYLHPQVMDNLPSYPHQNFAYLWAGQKYGIILCMLDFLLISCLMKSWYDFIFVVPLCDWNVYRLRLNIDC